MLLFVHTDKMLLTLLPCVSSLTSWSSKRKSSIFHHLFFWLPTIFVLYSQSTRLVFWYVLYAPMTLAVCIINTFLCKFIFHQFDCVSFTAQKKLKWEEREFCLSRTIFFSLACKKKESRKLIKFTYHAFGFDKKNEIFFF